MNLPRKLVVGVGSPHGDDQAGWLVADELMARLRRDDVKVRKAIAPLQLLDWLDEIDELLVCDACQGIGRPGDILRWTWPVDQLAAGNWSGTHGISLPATLRLAEQLERLPSRVVVWGIVGARGEPIATVAPAVAAAIPKLVDELTSELTPRRPIGTHSQTQPDVCRDARAITH